MSNRDVEIFDATVDSRYERFLYKCLAPAPYRKYRPRREYLEAAVTRGFQKKILVFNGQVAGQIEYAPPEDSGCPISGEGIIVMNCIWVLRKAKMHGFGLRLMKEMMEKKPDTAGFATIGLEGHWSPWLRASQLEKLGFKSIDSIRVTHNTKHTEKPFTVHLMWLPRCEDAKPPIWDKNKILEGVSFCMAHPLYHPQTYRQKEILRRLLF